MRKRSFLLRQSQMVYQAESTWYGPKKCQILIEKVEMSSKNMIKDMRTKIAQVIEEKVTI